MIKKIINIVIFIMIIVSFTACNKNGDEKGDKTLIYNVSYGEAHSVNHLSEINLTKRIDSLEALNNLIEENDYPFLNVDDSDYNQGLSQKIIEYNDLFFQEKSLILVFFYESSYYPAKIDSVSIRENIIRVIIARPESGAADDVLSVYNFIIEVTKKDVEGADKVETEQIVKGKMENYL